MLNKILLRKIKFPLSLRGAKRRSNLSGFSLIELMVAVTILAVAIFGIFHAYSVGFMGMVDARDRTVATNYMQEAMEDIKNMAFEKITTTTKSVITSNRKYRVDVNVTAESDNLKKVYTVVSWEDRNGIRKTVDSSMLVNFMEVFALAPAKIVLFADSYAILNNGGTTQLTAVIKDIKGNTIIGWGENLGEGNITFSKSGDDLGTLSSTEVEPDNGVAKTIFTSSEALSEDIGYTVITASVSIPDIGIVSDSVTIKVTDGPVKIELTAAPHTIKSNSSECSTITVSLQNAVGDTLKKNILVSSVEITFSVFGDFGEGDLSTSTIIIDANISSEDDAVATISLCPTSKRGLAIVIATSAGLESGRVDVKFLGPPVSILITANPNSLYVDDLEGSIITVSLIDKNGFNTNPVSGTIRISLALSTNPVDNYAILEDSYLDFSSTDAIGDSKTTKFMKQSIISTALIAASGEGLMGGSVTISIKSALVPDHIKLTADHQIIQAGGTSKIKATVYDGSKIVTNYTGTITFKTTLGFFSNTYDTITEDVVGGIATTVLNSSSDLPGNAIITITDPDPTVLPFNPSDGLVVGFYGVAHHITLTANPKYVKANGVSTSTITAAVYDSKGTIVLNYNEVITFTNTGTGNFIGDTTPNADKGIATIKIFSSYVGTAKITASAVGPTPGSVIVEFYEITTLTLVDGSAEYYPADLKVKFVVEAAGENILVDEMGISWTLPVATERFQKIVINGENVYTGNSLSGARVDIIDKILVAGVHNIVELTFGKGVPGKEFTVTFYPYSGSYKVEGITPITQ